jgi:Putative DNA-binding domain
MSHVEAQRQSALLAAIRTARADAALAGLHTGAVMPARGLGAYRANALAIAERALGAAFATVQTLLGPQNFQALARDFLHHHPPLKGDLGEWGAALPPFISQQTGLAAWPYLADCARLDHALHQCERAVDAEFDAASLARLGDTEPVRLRLHFLPGTALIESPWPVAAIHQAHAQPEGDARETLFAQVRVALQTPLASAALVWRDGWRAVVTPLDEHEVVWTRHVLAGASLADALLAADAAFDFDAWLTAAVVARRLKGISVRFD